MSVIEENLLTTPFCSHDNVLSDGLVCFTLHTSPASSPLLPSINIQEPLGPELWAHCMLSETTTTLSAHLSKSCTSGPSSSPRELSPEHTSPLAPSTPGGSHWIDLPPVSPIREEIPWGQELCLSVFLPSTSVISAWDSVGTPSICLQNKRINRGRCCFAFHLFVIYLILSLLCFSSS